MTSDILKGLTLLLVDDERYSRQVFGRALTEMGDPKLLLAENGAEALDLLDLGGSRVDVIVSDFNMPVVHGLQLLKAVRVGMKYIHRATPFAMLTGYSQKKLVDMALALDVNAFLIKPASKEALAKRLSSLLLQVNSDLWLKGRDVYETIDVDGALEDIAMSEDALKKVRGFELMPKDTPLFLEPGSPGEKTAGMQGRGLPNAPGSDKTSEKRPQLEGRLCALNELPENAVLARDVHIAQDVLLMHAGTELTPRIVSMLQDLRELDHPVEEFWIAAE